MVSVAKGTITISAQEYSRATSALGCCESYNLYSQIIDNFKLKFWLLSRANRTKQALIAVKPPKLPVGTRAYPKSFEIIGILLNKLRWGSRLFQA
jgi:hypothetical protein